MNPKISYIVAIYNTEKYLARCIDSLTAQRYDNVEILLIDDGSTDGSSEICRSYSQRFDNITYRKKANGGLSDARNYGIDRALGDYLIFVDSDDWCEPTQAEVLAKTASESSADIYAFGYYNDFTAEQMHKEFSLDETLKRGDTAVYGQNDIKQAVRALEKSQIFNTVWNKMYSHTFLKENGLKFDINGMPGEDILFNSAAFTLANKVGLCNKLLYHYMFQDEITLSRKFRADLYEKNLSFCDARKKVYDHFELDDENDKNVFAKCYVQYCFACIPNSFRTDAPKGYKHRAQIFRSLMGNDDFLRHLELVKHQSGQYKLLGALLNTNSSFLCYMVYGLIMFFRNHTKSLYNKIRMLKYKEKMDYVSK